MNSHLSPCQVHAPRTGSGTTHSTVTARLRLVVVLVMMFEVGPLKCVPNIDATTVVRWLRGRDFTDAFHLKRDSSLGIG